MQFLFATRLRRFFGCEFRKILTSTRLLLPAIGLNMPLQGAIIASEQMDILRAWEQRAEESQRDADLSVTSGFIAPLYSMKNQADYIAESKQIVRETIQLMLEQPIEELFESLLDFLGQKRGELAKKHHTENWQEFGKRRDETIFLLTYCNARYLTYSKKIVAAFDDHIPHTPHTTPYSFWIEKDNFGPYESQIEWSLCSVDKKTFPHWVYDKIPIIIEHVSGIFSFSYEKKQCFCSYYIDYSHQDTSFKTMRDLSKIAIVHPTGEEVAETFKIVRKLFAECVSWDESPDTFAEFKTKLATWSYLFAHLAPFSRGSAAIREWMECALLQLHGLTLSYNPRKVLDCEALTTWSLSKFLEIYDTIVQIYPMDLGN